MRAILLFFIGIVSHCAFGQDTFQGCKNTPEFQLLAFWVGKWDVLVGNQKIGENEISWIMDGCAIQENWRDGRGGTGTSLFYYQPTEKRWKQVWVTPNPYARGGVKEKVNNEKRDDGTIVFTGTLIDQEGKSYLDRTLLIPESNGTVMQIIQVSYDNGNHWTTVFDAIYQQTAKPLK